MTRQDISDSTGFDSDSEFQSADEVRKYFQRDSLVECVLPPADDDIPDQDWLDEAANLVIENGWHCKFAAGINEYDDEPVDYDGHANERRRAALLEDCR